MSLATPSAAKIQRQSRAEMAVGMAHGTRMLARTRPRPRNALFMISAMQMPIVVSIDHRDDGEQGGVPEGVPEHLAGLALEDVRVVVQPTNAVALRVMRPVFGSMPSIDLTNESRSADRIGYPITRPSTRRCGESRYRRQPADALGAGRGRAPGGLRLPVGRLVDRGRRGQLWTSLPRCAGPGRDTPARRPGYLLIDLELALQVLQRLVGRSSCRSAPRTPPPGSPGSRRRT